MFRSTTTKRGWTRPIAISPAVPLCAKCIAAPNAPYFADELAVALQLTAADDGLDTVSDGVVSLETSLQKLAELGIDRIEAGNTSAVDTVLLTGGMGNLPDLSSLLADSVAAGVTYFDEPLDVTLQLTAADDAVDGAADGTVTLQASLQQLADLGIDQIVSQDTGAAAVTDVVVAGGLGVLAPIQY